MATADSRRRIRWVAAAVACFVLLLVVLLWERNPFEGRDICFEEDWPGATDRFTTFTPVRCSDRGQKLGDPIGADYGELKFEDVDDDGTPEVIVESARWRCELSGSCHASREVVKVELAQPPHFTQLESVELPFGLRE